MKNKTVLIVTAALGIWSIFCLGKDYGYAQHVSKSRAEIIKYYTEAKKEN